MRILRVELSNYPLRAYAVTGLNPDGVLIVGGGWGDNLKAVKDFTNREADDHFIKLPGELILHLSFYLKALSWHASMA